MVSQFIKLYVWVGPSVVIISTVDKRLFLLAASIYGWRLIVPVAESI